MDPVFLVRAPLRISLGGGGTDLPSHYRRHGGFVVSAAIDRYVHVLLSSAPRDGYLLKHLEREEVANADEIGHPILRAAIGRHWNGRGLELTSVGDVPPGTGLGSSGAYTVCVLGALAHAAGAMPGPAELAERACRIEIEDLGRSVGKQDQYAAAFGGVNALTFNRDDSVSVEPIALPASAREAFASRLMLFFTGAQRSASAVLAAQVQRRSDPALLGNLARATALARESAAALAAGDVSRAGELLNEQWELKVERTRDATTPRIRELRQTALRAGARGVSLMGAGGGGFLLAYADDPAPVREAMAAAGSDELGFALDTEGCVAPTG